MYRSRVGQRFPRREGAGFQRSGCCDSPIHPQNVTPNGRFNTTTVTIENTSIQTNHGNSIPSHENPRDGYSISIQSTFPAGSSVSVGYQNHCHTDRTRLVESNFPPVPEAMRFVTISVGKTTRTNPEEAFPALTRQQIRPVPCIRTAGVSTLKPSRTCKIGAGPRTPEGCTNFRVTRDDSETSRGTFPQNGSKSENKNNIGIARINAGRS